MSDRPDVVCQSQTKKGKRKVENIEEYKDEIARLYHEEGLSIREIGERFGYSLAGMYGWFKKLGIPTNPDRRQRREERYNWKGGRQKTGLGYVHVLCPDHPYADSRGRVYEHRLVMEKHLGRYLRPDEHVHHKNGIKDDNRIENLELMTRSEHVALHSRMRKTDLGKCTMCDEPAIAKGMCKKHYMEEWRRRNPDYRRRYMSKNEKSG